MPFSTHENEAGNPGHLLLMVGVILATLMPAGRRWAPLVLPGALGFLLFAVSIRWQPFGGRLQLPVLVWLPVSAALLLHGSLVRWAALLALTALSASALYGNALRPLVPRGDRGVFSQPRELQYLAQRPRLGDPLRGAVQALRNAECRDVGIGAGYDFPEYLLRVEAARGQGPLRLRYLNPASHSGTLTADPEGGMVCAVLLLNPPVGWTLPPEVSGFELRYHRDPVAVLVDPDQANAGESVREPAR